MDLPDIKELLHRNKFILPAIVAGAGLGVIALITHKSSGDTSTSDPNTNADQTNIPGDSNTGSGSTDQSSILQQVSDLISQAIAGEDDKIAALADQTNQALSDLGTQFTNSLQTLANSFTGGAAGGYNYYPQYGFTDQPSNYDYGNTDLSGIYNPLSQPTDPTKGYSSIYGEVPARGLTPVNRLGTSTIGGTGVANRALKDLSSVVKIVAPKISTPHNSQSSGHSGSSSNHSSGSSSGGGGQSAVQIAQQTVKTNTTSGNNKTGQSNAPVSSSHSPTQGKDYTVPKTTVNPTTGGSGSSGGGGVHGSYKKTA